MALAVASPAIHGDVVSRHRGAVVSIGGLFIKGDSCGWTSSFSQVLFAGWTLEAMTTPPDGHRYVMLRDGQGRRMILRSVSAVHTTGVARRYFASTPRLLELCDLVSFLLMPAPSFRRAAWRINIITPPLPDGAGVQHGRCVLGLPVGRAMRVRGMFGASGPPHELHTLTMADGEGGRFFVLTPAEPPAPAGAAAADGSGGAAPPEAESSSAESESAHHAAFKGVLMVTLAPGESPDSPYIIATGDSDQDAQHLLQVWRQSFLGKERACGCATACPPRRSAAAARSG